MMRNQLIYQGYLSSYPMEQRNRPVWSMRTPFAPDQNWRLKKGDFGDDSSRP